MSPPLALHTTVLTPVPAPFSACLQRWPFGRGFTESQWCWRCKGSDCQTYEVGILYPTERLIQCCLAFTLVGNRLLLVPQVVIPTDSAGCLGKPRSLLPHIHASRSIFHQTGWVDWSELFDQAGIPGFGFVLNISNIQKRGRSFLNFMLFWMFMASRREQSKSRQLEALLALVQLVVDRWLWPN